MQVIAMIVVMMAMAAVVMNPRPVVMRTAHFSPFYPDRCTYAAVQQQSFCGHAGGNPCIWGIWVLDRIKIRFLPGALK